MDYGENWTKIVDGIPDDDFIHAVREDPTRSGLLYAASQETVYVSWGRWGSLAVSGPKSPRGRGLGPGGGKGRSRDRDARAVVLGVEEHRAAEADDR